MTESQLRVLIEQIVDQAIGKRVGNKGAGWQSEERRIEVGHTYDNRINKTYSNGFDFTGAARTMDQLGELSGIMSSLSQGGSESGSGDGESGGGTGALGNIRNIFAGIGGLQSAYKTGNPISGALSGFQTMTSLGSLFGASSSVLGALGWVGLAGGLLLGLFGGKDKTKTEWNRPKFKDAEKAYNKLFTVDRGEEDLYYMPESFYFRNGWSGARHIVVKVGNEQFNDHIRDSMTDSYATQLQRGLVF